MPVAPAVDPPDGKRDSATAAILYIQKAPASSGAFLCAK
jgi:hypothetical protein